MRDHLLAHDGPGLRQFRKLMEPAGTKRAAEHRRRRASESSVYLLVGLPDAIKSDLLRLIDRRAREEWKKPVERTEGRWKYQLALFLNECLTLQGETDV